MDLLARCLALAYLPVDEDSYGYPSLEASHSFKPIVTLSDSGGALEFVRDGKEGLVANPNPRDLGAAFDRLYEDRGRSRAHGGTESLAAGRAKHFLVLTSSAGCSASTRMRLLVANSASPFVQGRIRVPRGTTCGRTPKGRS